MEIIEIEDNWYSADFSYAGTYKVEDKEYPFTLLNTDIENFVIWDEEVPGGDDIETKIIEEKILSEFRKK